MSSLARADAGAALPSSEAPGLDLETDILHAVARGELVLHFQPIVGLRDGRCHRVEALLRWHHPSGKLLSPRLALGAAERAGGATAIEEWVLDAALRQVASWRSKGLELAVAVNLTASALARAKAPTAVLAALGRQGLPAGVLTVELPSAALGDADTPGQIARLAATGIHVALDDLGATEPVSRVGARHIDELKISRAVIARVATDSTTGIVVRAIVEIGRDVGARVVAVGVEDERTRDALLGLGCDEAQGFWMSRPLVAQDVGRWRQLVAGAAFVGAMAVTGHGATRADAAETPRVPTEVHSFAPTFCLLDLPTFTPTKPTDRSLAETIAARSGVSFEHRTTGRADLFFDGTIALADRQRIAGALDAAVERAERSYGVGFASRPLVYVLGTRPAFAMLLERGYGYNTPTAGLLAAANGGVADPRTNSVIVNWTNVGPASLSIFDHELTHLIVHQITGPTATLPAWLDEGLARLAERDANGTAASRQTYIARALVASGQVSLTRLQSPTDWALRNADLGGRGYDVAAEAADLLRSRVSGGMPRLLADTARTGDFAAAYASDAGESLSSFDAAFPARLAEASGGPGVAISPSDGSVRYLVFGFAPGAELRVAITGEGYDVRFVARADQHGIYEAIFGTTAAPGRYAVSVDGRGGHAEGELVVSRPR